MIRPYVVFVEALRKINVMISSSVRKVSIHPPLTSGLDYAKEVFENRALDRLG